MINNKIKLVIWDMDETFWKGTISEGEIEPVNTNIQLVKDLVDRGIMQSISSKNDFDVVKGKLSELGIWDLFVFPKINWNSKAAQIKQIITECNLRPINTLFIDDNPHNLGEAIALLPEINTAYPSIIPSLLDLEYLKGNDDRNRDRLKQFKILEEKASAQSSYSSNEEFLRQSNIKVDILYDCKDHKDRILDLINRSNQLNYTKIRLSAKELEELLDNPKYKSCYVSVKDNYGDYGIVGFASIAENKAKHFLFSCRTIGMGVEQYVYAKLNYPQLNRVGSVISDVKKDFEPDWINMEQKTERKNSQRMDISVLLHGGCDLSQMEPYLYFKNLTTEYNLGKFHRDHTLCALNAYNKYDELTEIQEKIPLLSKDDFYTEIFTDKYDIVVISVLQDYSQGVYRYKKNKNIKIALGSFDEPITPNQLEGCKSEDLEWFFDNFEFEGRIQPQDFMKNLQFIRNHMNKDIALIIINGVEVPCYTNSSEPDRYKVHIEMNKIVDEFVAQSENTYLLDVRKFVVKSEQLTDRIRHYERKVYFNIAKELSKIIKEHCGENIKVRRVINTKSFVKKVLKNIFSVGNVRKDGYKYKVLIIFGIKIVLTKNTN